MARITGSRLTTIGKREAVLDGQAISYILKLSLKAKYARLEVRPQSGLTVVIPKFYRLTQLGHLLREKRHWILAKLAHYAQPEPLFAEKQVKISHSIPYLGRELKVIEQQNQGAADSVRLEKGRLVVSLKSGATGLSLLLEQWYRQQAERLIKAKADELCPRLGVTYSRIVIRAAKTRWGSCSRKGNLNFNWKLMMAPEPVIDYVIVHELAHLREMNHSKKFWKLVADHCPQWRKRRQWLKNHDGELAAKLFGRGQT